ncbi:MAG: fumarylacetoacetate hydrolase family protein [Rhizobiaceae bacterium]|nr:fumarylacetoacetate hydrolase family protein [Rhizobiaceae bacterium]
MRDDSAAATAAEVLACLDGRSQRPPFTANGPGLSEADAYRVTAELRRLREARGERPVGRKIGFTNRNIWAEYGVFQPIWGDIYDTTVTSIMPGATIRVSHLPEPRVEPEIVVGLVRDVEAAEGLDGVVRAVGWVAHGFEIVQSIFPGWRFSVADCVADGGLHGALYVGPRRSVSDGERKGLADALAGLTLELSRNGQVMDRGAGANVLDGPLQALAHLVRVLAADPVNPPLRAGEIVTTGTLTRAFPIQAGESWATRIGGFDLPGLSVSTA